MKNFLMLRGDLDKGFGFGQVTFELPMKLQMKKPS